MTLATSDGSDAERSIHFAQALAMFLFTLPAKVTRGLKESSPKPMKSKRQATDAGKTA